MDGQTDFTQYSYLELLEAASRIDDRKFPLNAAALKAELARRAPAEQQRRVAQGKLALDDLVKGAPVFGGLQLAAAVVVLFTYGPSALAGQLPGGTLALMAVVVSLDGIAGALLIRGARLGLVLGIVNYSLQIPRLVVGTSYYSYTGLGAIWLMFSNVGAAWKVKIAAPSLGPNLALGTGAGADVLLIGVDLAAIAVVAMLVTILRARGT